MSPFWGQESRCSLVRSSVSATFVAAKRLPWFCWSPCNSLSSQNSIPWLKERGLSQGMAPRGRHYAGETIWYKKPTTSLYSLVQLPGILGLKSRSRAWGKGEEEGWDLSATETENAHRQACLAIAESEFLCKLGMELGGRGITTYAVIRFLIC